MACEVHEHTINVCRCLHSQLRVFRSWAEHPIRALICEHVLPELLLQRAWQMTLLRFCCVALGRCCNVARQLLLLRGRCASF